MNGKVTVRLATIADVKLLNNFARLSFYEMWKDYNTDEDLDKYMNEFFTEEVLITEINDPNIDYFIALYDNEIAGYCKLKRNYKEGNLPDVPCIELQRMYTTLKTIRKGIGSSLMNHCLAISKHEGFIVMWLGVFEKNFRAIAFYSRFGFTTYGSHDFVLGNDVTTDLLMMKTIQ